MKNGFLFSFQKGAELMKPMDWAKEKYSPQKSCKAFYTHTHTNVFVYIYKKENKIQPAG